MIIVLSIGLLHLFCSLTTTNLVSQIYFIEHSFHAKGTENMKKRGHGTLKGLKAINKRARAGNQKLKIEFLRLGGLVGENKRTFVDEIVVFSRKRAPLIRVRSWKNIDQHVKDLIASDVLVRFVVLVVLYPLNLSKMQQLIYYLYVL